MNNLHRAALLAGGGLILAVIAMLIDGRLGTFLGGAAFIAAVAMEVMATETGEAASSSTRLAAHARRDDQVEAVF